MKTLLVLILSLGLIACDDDAVIYEGYNKRYACFKLPNFPYEKHKHYVCVKDTWRCKMAVRDASKHYQRLFITEIMETIWSEDLDETKSYLRKKCEVDLKRERRY